MIVAFRSTLGRGRNPFLAAALAAIAGVASIGIPSAQAAGSSVTDLGANVFPYAMNNSDHIAMGRPVIEEGEEDILGPWLIWAEGKTTRLEPINAPETEEKTAGKLKEVNIQGINEAGNVGGTSSVQVTSERSVLRAVSYSAGGVVHEVPLLQDPLINSKKEPFHVGSVGMGIDDAGDVAGTGAIQTEEGTPPVGRAFFAPGGGTPQIVGEADRPFGGESEIRGMNDAGQMLGDTAQSEFLERKYFIWSSPASPGTPLNFDEAFYIANDGSVVGERAGKRILRLPDGREEEIAGLKFGYRPNSLHQVAGSISAGGGEHAAIWQAGKITDLNTLLPEKSPWVLQRAFVLNDKGEVAGVGTLGGVPHGFLLKGGAKISGTVYGLTCGADECKQAGLAGQTILVTGKASDGSSVSVTSTSDAAGGWSVTVPTGSYEVGPTPNEEDLGGAGFQAPSVRKVEVAGGDVEHVDFTTCAGNAAPVDPVASATRVRSAKAILARARAAHRSPFARAAGSGSANPLCTGVYTFQLSAKIHQKTFVDPSQLAPYATKADGEGFQRDADSTEPGRFLGKLPECKVFDGERDHPPHVKFLSYYLGTKALGTVTVPVEYHAPFIELGTPKFGEGTLTRVYEYEHGGSRKKCKVKREVTPEFSFSVKNKQFQLVVSWELPFAPEGEAHVDLKKIKLAGDALHKLIHETAEKVPGFEHLPKLYQTAIIAGVAKLAEGPGFHFVGHHLPSTETILSMVESGIEVEKAGNIAIWLANAGVKKTRGFLGYHPMTTVIRGELKRTDCPKLPHMTITRCEYTSLAFDVTHNKFPDYAMTVLRNGRVIARSSVSTPAPIAYSAGGEAGPLPGEVKSSIEASRGGTADMLELKRAIEEPIPESAAEIGAGGSASGLPSATPGCDVEIDDKRIKENVLALIRATTAHTMCWGFGDGNP